MANYKSQHTGEQIDSAVTKINGVNYTSEQINSSIEKSNNSIQQVSSAYNSLYSRINNSDRLIKLGSGFSINGDTLNVNGGLTPTPSNIQYSTKRDFIVNPNVSVNAEYDVIAYPHFFYTCDNAQKNNYLISKIIIRNTEIIYVTGDYEDTAYTGSEWVSDVYKLLVFEGDIPQWVIENSILDSSTLYLHTFKLEGIESGKFFLKSVSPLKYVTIDDTDDDMTKLINLVQNFGLVSKFNVMFFDIPILAHFGTLADYTYIDVVYITKSNDDYIIKKTTITPSNIIDYTIEPYA